MKLYNTKTRSIEEFEPLDLKTAKMYACGPTVYDYAHIGHMRKYIGDDILRRTLAKQWEVNHVMNVTDVGHLSSDSDHGEDKMEKGAKKFNKSVLEIARFFEEDFLKSIKRVNVLTPTTIARATEHIDDQIALIEELVKKGFTYQTDEAIYFDVSKFPGYTNLSKQDLDDKLTGARDEVIIDRSKKNPADFVLWFFTIGRFKDHVLRWESPWGTGFPGWHIECSAMAMRYLGPTIDIHTGGVDHISIHHTNEIAQSECATGVEFVRFWIHHEHLRVEGEKMSKSLGNFITVKDLEQKGFNPLTFRYLTFQTHYRAEMNFTWEALEASQTALEKLYEVAAELKDFNKFSDIDYIGSFMDALNQDLNMPKAVSIMWEMVRSAKVEDSVKATTLQEMDEVLGLSIFENSKKRLSIPPHIMRMVEERDLYKRNRQYTQADHARNKIEKLGYVLKDVVDENKRKKTIVLRKI
ncbi:MAG: cysteine--tRNA ligase [Candidatus Levybacteria bacterium]|nr:cysteine--tRNA ligase [Candidatus Levybacteria bacterium]